MKTLNITGMTEANKTKKLESALSKIEGWDSRRAKTVVNATIIEILFNNGVQVVDSDNE
jgi:hypothetical protein